jgi:hypothetical protein
MRALRQAEGTRPTRSPAACPGQGEAADGSRSEQCVHPSAPRDERSCQPRSLASVPVPPLSVIVQAFPARTACRHTSHEPWRHVARPLRVSDAPRVVIPGGSPRPSGRSLVHDRECAHLPELSQGRDRPGVCEAHLDVSGEAPGRRLQRREGNIITRVHVTTGAHVSTSALGDHRAGPGRSAALGDGSHERRDAKWTAAGVLRPGPSSASEAGHAAGRSVTPLPWAPWTTAAPTAAHLRPEGRRKDR